MRARRRAALVACRFGRTRRHARRRVCGYLRGAAAARPLRCEPRLELCGRARRALCARLRRHGRDARRRVVLGCKARRRKEHGRAGQRGKERFHSSVSSGTADTTPGHYFIALIYYGRAAAEVPALHNLNISRVRLPCSADSGGHVLCARPPRLYCLLPHRERCFWRDGRVA